jgi:hypothetical protein
VATDEVRRLYTRTRAWRLGLLHGFGFYIFIFIFVSAHPSLLLSLRELGGLCSDCCCSGLVSLFLALCTVREMWLCCTLMPCGFIYKARPRAFCLKSEKQDLKAHT